MDLRIVAHNWDPISILKNESGSTQVNGVMGKLLQIILHERNISYKVFASDANLGIPLLNGSWTGMSGHLQRNEADIILGPPIMSYGRTKIMDFSTPLMFDKYSILSHYKNTKVLDLLKYLRFFDSLTWALIVLSLLLSLLVFIITDRLLSNNSKFKSISDYLLFIMEITLLKSSYKVPDNDINRFLCGLLMIMMYTTVVIINAMIGMDLVVNRKRDVINSLEDLSLRKSCIPVSFKNTIAGYAFLEAVNSTDPETNHYERVIGQRMIQIEENESFASQYINKLVNDEVAYVTAEIRLLIIAMNICRKNPDSELYLGSEKTYAIPRALGFSKYTVNSDLKKKINTDIEKLKSSGLFAFWMDNAMNKTLLQCIKKSEEERNKSEDHHKIVVTLSLLKTLFIYFGCFLCLSFSIFILEVTFVDMKLVRVFKSNYCEN